MATMINFPAAMFIRPRNNVVGSRNALIRKYDF